MKRLKEFLSKGILLNHHHHMINHKGVCIYLSITYYFHLIGGIYK